MMSQATAGKDFFISYTRADRTWAEWIAFQLEEAGYITILQAWDFRPGSNFVLEMDNAARIAKRTIAVLSPDYFQSGFTPSEWAAAFRRDPKGEQHLLVPVRVQPCDVEGLLGSIIYIDLVSLGEQEARTALLEGVRRERAKPSSVPFPLEARASTPPPAFPNTLPSVWTVPYRRNPYFTGRENELAVLANSLGTGETLALTQSLSGLGGIGKTQLAVEYAYRFRDRYRAVLWVSADSRETLIAGCAELAAELKPPEQGERNQNRIVAALQRWLGEQQGPSDELKRLIAQVAAFQRWLREQQAWLLILDNVVDLGLVTWLLPVQHQGVVLLTTRRQVTEPVAQTIAVDVLPEKEAALFLLRRTKFLSLNGSLDEATEADRQMAQSIARTLGGLPLALDQAGAYILETRCDLATYLSLYKQRPAELLQRRGSIPSDHPPSVTTTFTLAFEEVRRRSEAAIELLQLCAFLAPDAIAEEIITGGATHLGSVLQPVAADAYALNEIIEILRAFSLIKRDPVEKILNMHRLVQAVAKDRMNPEVYQQWAERTVQVVNQVFSDITPTTWVLYERYLPHALVCAELIRHQKKESAEAGQLLAQTGYYLWQRGLYPEAESLLEQAIAIHERVLERDDPLLANSFNRLAGLYFTQGKYAQAELLVQRALAIREQVFGPDHLQLAAPLNNLAVLYKAQGKYKQAESVYQRALAIREKMQGLDHPDVGESLTNLAELYYIQGKYAQAESLYRRSIAIFEQVFGPDHLSESPVLNFLAELCYTQGKYARAESLVQRALAIREKALGPDHRQMAESLYTLAKLHYAQGKYAQAELLFQDALRIWEKALGPDHPETAECLNTLAELYYAQGTYAQAKRLYQRALRIWKQHFGLQHPNVAYSLNGLANLYREQGKYAQAERLYQRALHIHEQSLGFQHPETAKTMHDLARLREAQGNSEEARTWYAQALAAYEQVLGGYHPKTTETRKHLIALLHAMEQHEEAAQLEAAQAEQGTSEEERKMHPEE